MNGPVMTDHELAVALELTLEDRLLLRSAHLRTVARHAEAGVPMSLTPAQVADTARLLAACAQLLPRCP